MPTEISDEKKEHRDLPGNATVSANGHFTVVNPLVPSQLLFYSLAPSVVPPYVLDKISQAHYKDQLNNTNVNNNQSDTLLLVRSNSTAKDDEQFASFANDPFISAVGHNWPDFIHAVKAPTQFTVDRVAHIDLYSNYEDFSKPWGGDERLRLALLGPGQGESLSNLEKTPGFWSRLFARNSNRLADSPRHRLKAGYWMLDEKRKDLLPTLRRIFVQNPLVPLLLRVLGLIFSACSLALACSIFVQLRRKYQNTTITQEPSTIFAIVVQSFAIPYIVYIAYDEYSGKPLGLRNPVDKMKLIMLDLFFIICSSANLSLTFNSLFDDEWVCMVSNNTLQAVPTVGSLCRRQRALSSFLLVVLCLWVVTFTISIFRIVDRVSVSPRSD